MCLANMPHAGESNTVIRLNKQVSSSWARKKKMSRLQARIVEIAHTYFRCHALCNLSFGPLEVRRVAGAGACLKRDAAARDLVSRRESRRLWRSVCAATCKLETIACITHDARMAVRCAHILSVPVDPTSIPAGPGLTVYRHHVSLLPVQTASKKSWTLLEKAHEYI